MKKKLATYKNDKLIERNLLSWFREASASEIKDGITWYKRGSKFCNYLASEYDLDPYIAACVTSALSPLNPWERNKTDAENVVKAWKAGKGPEDVKVCTFGKNKVKAFSALIDGISIKKKARKTHNFLLNLSGSVEPVTVDRWHVRACLLKAGSRVEDVSVAVNDHQYDRVELITKKLAKREGINPCEFQAVIWVVIRNRLSSKLK